MKSLLISIVAVTFLGASGTALAASPKRETLPLGIQKQLERNYSLARSDQDNFLHVQHGYDDRRHRPHQKYRHEKPHHPKYSHGKYKQKNYRHKKYGHGKHWHKKHHYHGYQKRGHGYRHGYSGHSHYDKHRNDLSIRLKFGSDGLIHYQSR